MQDLGQSFLLSKVTCWAEGGRGKRWHGPVTDFTPVRLGDKELQPNFPHKMVSFQPVQLLPLELKVGVLLYSLGIYHVPINYWEMVIHPTQVVSD